MKLSMLYKCTFFLVSVLACMSGKVKADDLSVEFSGFATLSMSYSDHSDITFSSNYLNKTEADFSLKRDSILGGQANFTLHNDWDGVAQVIYQDRYNKAFDNVLELAFLRYRPQRNWTIRAGRLNSDLYLLSEYPYVGYAYLWARPPHSYYSFSSTISHYDGVDVEYDAQINDGFFRIKLGIGETTTELGVHGGNFSVTFDDLYMFSAEYLKNEWLVKVTTSNFNFSNFESPPFSYLIDGLGMLSQMGWGAKPAQLAEDLSPTNHTMDYSALGLVYDGVNWLIQAEISSVESDWMAMPSNINGYLSVGYRVNDVTYYSSYSVAKNEKAPPLVISSDPLVYLPEDVQVVTKTLIDQINYTTRRSMVNQESINIGAKWHYSDSLALKMQVDHFMLGSDGSTLWGINAADVDIAEEHNVNLISVSASWVF